MDIEERDISFWDLLFYYYKFRWYLLSFILIVTTIAALFSFLTKPRYKATTKLIIDETTLSNTIMLPGIQDMYSRNTQMNNYRYMLKSRTLAERVIGKLRENKDIEFDSSYTWKKIIDNTEASIVPKSDIIEVSFTDNSPEYAAIIANTISSEFYLMQQEISRAEIKGMSDFLSSQLKKIEKQLQEDEDSLKIFKQKIGITDLSEELKKQINIYSSLQAELTNARILSAYYRKKIDQLSKELGIKTISSENISDLILTPSVISLKNLLNQKESEKATLISMGYNNNHPRIKEINNQIKTIKREINSKISSSNVNGLLLSSSLNLNDEFLSSFINTATEIVALDGKIDAYNKAIEKLQKKLNMMPVWSTDLARKERNKDITEQIYLMLKKKYEELKISEAGKLGNVKILDKAYAPVHPVYPQKKKTILLAFFVSLFLSVIFILIYAIMDDSFHSSEEIEKLTGVSVLALIPFSKISSKNNGKRNGKDISREIEKRLISHFSPLSLTAESYKTLRTQLLFTQKNKKIFVITSTLQGEGKTTVSLNLAITLAQTGKKVLVIDADMRRPTIYKVFKDSINEEGLLHYLIGEAKISDIIYPVLSVKNLHVIPHGGIPSNPSEILGSSNMTKLLENVKNDFDYIIIDTPPVMAVTDPVVLASSADSVLFVVSAKNSSRRALKIALKQIASVGAFIGGIVFNSVDFEGQYGNYYKYRYNYYSHYYSE